MPPKRKPSGKPPPVPLANSSAKIPRDNATTSNTATTATIVTAASGSGGGGGGGGNDETDTVELKQEKPDPVPAASTERPAKRTRTSATGAGVAAASDGGGGGNGGKKQPPRQAQAASGEKKAQAAAKKKPASTAGRKTSSAAKGGKGGGKSGDAGGKKAAPSTPEEYLAELSHESKEFMHKYKQSLWSKSDMVKAALKSYKRELKSNKPDPQQEEQLAEIHANLREAAGGGGTSSAMTSVRENPLFIMTNELMKMSGVMLKCHQDVDKVSQRREFELPRETWAQDDMAMRDLLDCGKQYALKLVEHYINPGSHGIVQEDKGGHHDSTFSVVQGGVGLGIHGGKEMEGQGVIPGSRITNPAPTNAHTDVESLAVSMLERSKEVTELKGTWGKMAHAQMTGLIGVVRAMEEMADGSPY